MGRIRAPLALTRLADAPAAAECRAAQAAVDRAVIPAADTAPGLVAAASPADGHRVVAADVLLAAVAAVAPAEEAAATPAVAAEGRPRPNKAEAYTAFVGTRTGFPRLFQSLRTRS
jgi:hypothetical protein